MGKELGVCIKHFRNQKKMTQEELAKAVGVATITIRQYESGAREPNTSVLGKIAEVLGVGEGPFSFYPAEQKDKAIMYTLVQALNGKEYSEIPAYTPLNENLRQIEYSLNQMNEDGQLIAVERVKELAQIPAYQKPAEPNPDKK